jgi:hypothetical protein
MVVGSSVFHFPLLVSLWLAPSEVFTTNGALSYGVTAVWTTACAICAWRATSVTDHQRWAVMYIAILSMAVLLPVHYGYSWYAILFTEIGLLWLSGQGAMRPQVISQKPTVG